MTWLQAPSRQTEVTVSVAFSWSVGTDHLTGTQPGRGPWDVQCHDFVSGWTHEVSSAGRILPTASAHLRSTLFSENPAWFWGPDLPPSPEWCQGSDGLPVGLLAAHRPPAWPGGPDFAVCLKS